MGTRQRGLDGRGLPSLLESAVRPAAGRLGENKAIVAIARKRLVVVWHVLTRQESDKHADAALVARKLLRRAWQLKAAGRQGQSAGAWVRDELDRLNLGQELTGITIGKVVHRLPAPTTRRGGE